MEIPMSQKLTIRAFFFNAKTDYLPYYKNFTITTDDAATVKDLLALIQEENENFSYPKQKLHMKINGWVVDAKQSVDSIVKRLGTELQLDPVNAYRSNDGLKINDSDFMVSYALLEPYATEADLKYYKTLYALHYASETEKFDHEYIGDAILILAHKMISEGNSHKDEILDAITSPHSGLFDCEYENNLFNEQSYAATITALKEMAKDDGGEHPSLLEMIKSHFLKDDTQKDTTIKAPERTAITIENIKDKQVAYYPGKCYSTVVLEQIKAHNISMITFDRMHKLSGTTLVDDNKTLAFKKAGATLLEAFDAGAEVVIVEDNIAYAMMKNNFSAIEKVLGRKMIGLELISTEDFISQFSTITAA